MILGSIAAMAGKRFPQFFRIERRCAGPGDTETASPGSRTSRVQIDLLPSRRARCWRLCDHQRFMRARRFDGGFGGRRGRPLRLFDFRAIVASNTIDELHSFFAFFFCDTCERTCEAMLEFAGLNISLARRGCFSYGARSDGFRREAIFLRSALLR